MASYERSLIVVAAIALTALGISLFDLVAEDENESGSVRPADVRALEDRIGELEDEVEQAPTRVQVSIRDEQRALDERLDALEERTSEAVEDVRQDVEALEERVDELERLTRDLGSSPAAGDLLRPR
jgi:chromosome segregation ATPase